MIVNIELENTADFTFIKKLLENIKGIKSVSVEQDDEIYEDGTPKWFIDKLSEYADGLEEKDMISEEEFFCKRQKKSMRIIFSEIASRSYEDIIEFLSGNWTEKEINLFIDEAEKVAGKLKEGKFNLYQKYSHDVRSALIGKKHVRMFFRKENDDLIKVLLFFDMRQDPQKILDLLS